MTEEIEEKSIYPRVWKFPLHEVPGNFPRGQVGIKMPPERELLHVDVQKIWEPYAQTPDEQICVWARVMPVEEYKYTTKSFFVQETGKMAPETAEHLETLLLLDGNYVLHVFDHD